MELFVAGAVVLAFVLGYVCGVRDRKVYAAVDVPERVPAAYTPTCLPILSEGQHVAVLFMDGERELHNRGYAASEIQEVLTRPKGGEPEEWYEFSRIDARGRFIYQLTASSKD